MRGSFAAMAGPSNPGASAPAMTAVAAVKGRPENDHQLHDFVDRRHAGLVPCPHGPAGTGEGDGPDAERGGLPTSSRGWR
jgi:hypothetical protein